ARPLVPHVRDPLQRLLGVLRLAVAEVRDRDVGPFAGERDRDRASDAAVASGDERDAVTEPPVAHVAVLAVIGRRKQVGLDTGVLLHLLGKRWLLARCPRIGLRRHETLPPRCPCSPRRAAQGRGSRGNALVLGGRAMHAPRDMHDLAVLFEHPAWQEPLFAALDARGVDYVRIDLKRAAYASDEA